MIRDTLLTKRTILGTCAPRRKTVSSKSGWKYGTPSMMLYHIIVTPSDPAFTPEDFPDNFPKDHGRTSYQVEQENADDAEDNAVTECFADQRISEHRNNRRIPGHLIQLLIKQRHLCIFDFKAGVIISNVNRDAIIVAVDRVRSSPIQLFQTFPVLGEILMNVP